MSLLSLPDELKLSIFSKLDVKDLNNLMVVNHEFKILSRDRYIWSDLIKRRFGISSEENNSYRLYMSLSNEQPKRLTIRRYMLALLTSNKLEIEDNLRTLFKYNGLDGIDKVFHISEKLHQIMNNYGIKYLDVLYWFDRDNFERLAREYGEMYFKCPTFYDDFCAFAYDLTKDITTFMLFMGIDPNLFTLYDFPGLNLELALARGFSLFKSRSKSPIDDLLLFIGLDNDNHDDLIHIDIIRMLMRGFEHSGLDRVVIRERMVTLKINLEEKLNNIRRIIYTKWSKPGYYSCSTTYQDDIGLANVYEDKMTNLQNIIDVIDEYDRL